jgi:shikimate dehydrogenase
VGEPFRIHDDVVALLGDPVDGNPVPFMYQAATDQLNLNFRFIRLRVATDNLEAAIRGAHALGFKGLIVTMPYKIRALEIVDEVEEAGKLIGAINRVYFENGKMIGDDTDGAGFLKGLKEKTEIKDKRIVQFGCGGAGRAIATFVGREKPLHMTIVNRQKSKAIELAARLKNQFSIDVEGLEWTGTYALASDVDIVINTTSIGLYPNVNDTLPLDFDSLQKHMIVCDVIPNPKETHFLREAKKRGCITLDGQVMVINQGTICLKRLTGLEPDQNTMAKALDKCILP